MLWIKNQIKFWPNCAFWAFCFKNTTSGFVCFLNGDLGSICIRPGTLQIQRSKYDRVSPAQHWEPASFVSHWEMVNGASAGTPETRDWPPRWHDDSKWTTTMMQGHLQWLQNAVLADVIRSHYCFISQCKCWSSIPKTDLLLPTCSQKCTCPMNQCFTYLCHKPLPGSSRDEWQFSTTVPSS